MHIWFVLQSMTGKEIQIYFDRILSGGLYRTKVVPCYSDPNFII